MLARIRKSLDEKDQGFTLIELLVVMIIIGILAAIAIPVFLSQRGKARETAAKSDVSVIGKELAAYYVDGNLVTTATGSAGAWAVTDSAGATVTSGKLSGANSVTGGGKVDGTYCVAVTTGTTGDATWSFDSAKGLQKKAC